VFYRMLKTVIVIQSKWRINFFINRLIKTFLFLDNCTAKKSAIIFDDVSGRNSNSNNNNNNRTSRCWQLEFLFPAQTSNLLPFIRSFSTSTVEASKTMVTSICARHNSWNAFWQLSSWWSASPGQPGKSCQTKERAKDRS